MKYFKYYFVLSAIIVFASCGEVEQDFDANGHFETTEIHVYAENPGRLVYFIPETGVSLKKGQLAGLVDTTDLYLQKEQARTQISSALVKVPGVVAQKNVVLKEIATLDFEIDRITKLVKSGAATRKQLDDLNNKKVVASAGLSTYDYQIQAIRAETEVIKAQILLIDNKIRKSSISAPIDGLVLEKFVSESELVTPGKILFTMAAVDQMELKAYVSGKQLSNLEIGQDVKVRIDWDEKEFKEYSGIISWVSSEAEFTPKIIQTKEERVNLVYAIKIRVKNDGKIKIGMPGGVIF